MNHQVGFRFGFKKFSEDLGVARKGWLFYALMGTSNKYVQQYYTPEWL